MISSDSFAFYSSNNTKNCFDLLATRSFTRPVFLDLGGRPQPFLAAGIQNSQHETRISSIQLFQFTSPDDGGIGVIRDRNKEEKMLKKVEMGKNPEECLTEMSKNGKIQDGLGLKMM